MTLARTLYESERAGAAPWAADAMPAWEDLRDGHVTRAFYERMAAVAERACAGSDAATANAQRDALADAVAELLPAVEAERADRKDFEFSTADAQQRKRRTTRLLGKVKAAIEEARRR